MKSIRTLATVVVVFGMSSYAQAGLLDGLFGHKGGACDASDACDANKCCDCAPTCEPECCKPVICRPCHTNVYTYQRKLSCLKPPVCDPCGRLISPSTCGPDGCAPGCGPDGCAPGYGADACTAPCGPAACAPSTNPCAAPCGPQGCDNMAGNVCCPGGAGNGCCDANGCCPGGCCPQMAEQACEVAKLIYESQTACDPSDREEAIDELDDYSICCFPEIMAAMLYALNDCDPGVRAQAADEIGDALEDNPCLCNQCVISALTCALADCDDQVVDQAEEALEACGYEIVDCCELPCDVCCDAGCAPGYGNGCAPMGQPVPMQPAPMNEGGAAPAPVPPEDTKAYFPRQLPGQSARPLSKKFSLSRLFSLVD